MTNEMQRTEIAVIGGGGAGFFAAITAAERNPRATVTIFEKSSRFLSKVRISGGGRCNVTHACFDPAELAGRFPRGSRELRGAFHRWQPRDTIRWFEERGVALKTEDDGRIFPVTDDSATVVDCFLEAAREAGVRLRTQTAIRGITIAPDGFWLRMQDDTVTRADRVFVAPGSLQSSLIGASLRDLGHTIEPLAPSLFSFHVSDGRIRGLQGISVSRARVRVLPKSGPREGPVLITHEGFSGPAILRLSAWEARRLQALDYRFDIALQWLADHTPESLRAELASRRKRSGDRKVKNTPMEGIPKRLWESLCRVSGIGESATWARLKSEQERALVTELTGARYSVRGKTMNKEEFVTCGGIRLKEVDFRSMESRIVPGLYFGGECLDIDGITGGFNFQSAWTTGRIAGEAMVSGGQRS